MMIKQIPVLLITGYLGSGKTTLLNRILNNKRGIKFAVIVNDIGEVNIDANLIEQGGVVGKKDDSLVALQNGCICCTLKMDLVEQLHDITCMDKFDYIAIEASGICEPEPIAQTICSIPQMGKKYLENGLARLDCIVTVVDALRMRDEFGCGDDLMKKHIGEEDIENLVIQQVEFCNKILLNKVDEVSSEELDRIKKIIRALQPKAEILECNYGDVDFDKILHTGLFDFERWLLLPHGFVSSKAITTKMSMSTKKNTSMNTKTTNIITTTMITRKMKKVITITDITTIITTMRVKLRNMVSVHSCTTVAQRSTWRTSTTSWLPNGHRM